jgi:hypothetical protein
MTSSGIEPATFRLDVMKLYNFTLLIAVLGEICFEENCGNTRIITLLTAIGNFMLRCGNTLIL